MERSVHALKQYKITSSHKELINQEAKSTYTKLLRAKRERERN